MSKSLTLEQLGIIRASLFLIGTLSEEGTRKGISKQKRRSCAETIARNVSVIRDILTHFPDTEPAPVKKPRAPRKTKTTDSSAPEPVPALER